MIRLEGVIFTASCGTHIRNFITEVQETMKVRDTIESLDGISLPNYEKLKFYGNFNSCLFEIKKCEKVEEAEKRWNQGFYGKKPRKIQNG